jgi:HAD superfamily hydrolase (TIGR01549 family)|tara:strand:+ start:2414 stop:3049 length:636 start_codon:yes stop_codon:yes gene_type:complete
MKKELVNSTFKTLIFDLNGTITGRVSEHPDHIAFRDHYIMEKLGKSLSGKLPNTTSLALQICGLSPSQYYTYRNQVIDWNLFHEYSESTVLAFQRLKKDGYTLVLYTDCLGEQIKRTLKVLGKENLFDLIISEEFNLKKPTPQAFKYVADRFGCSYSDMLMIGNDYNKDLLPLKILGGNIIQIDGEHELPELFELLAINNTFETKTGFKDA